MSAVVTHQNDANPVCQHPVDEMVGKSLQVGPVESRFNRVEPAGIFGHPADHTTELLHKPLSQAIRNSIIMADDFH